MEEESHLPQVTGDGIEEHLTPNESSVDAADLNETEREEVTDKIISDISTLKDKIKGCESVVALGNVTDPRLKEESIADLISYKDKINKLASKAVVVNYELVLKAAKGHLNKGDENADLRQEAFLIAQKAFIDYDSQRGGYSPYVYMCVYKGLLNYQDPYLKPVPSEMKVLLKEYRKSLDDPKYSKTPDEVVFSQLYPNLYPKYVEQKNNESGNFSVGEFLLIRPDKEKEFNARKLNMEKANSSYDILSLEAVPETLADSTQETGEIGEIVEEALLRDSITQVLDSSDLTERERKVIGAHFGLVDNKDFTLEQIANYLGVTRERVRQIEAKALRKLRKPSNSKRLRDYL